MQVDYKAQRLHGAGLLESQSYGTQASFLSVGFWQKSER